MHLANAGACGAQRIENARIEGSRHVHRRRPLVDRPGIRDTPRSRSEIAVAHGEYH
jgi:hypothetical protein